MPLKQWVLYQGLDKCTGIVVSRKSKLIRIKLSKKLLDVKEYTNVEGPTNCKAAMSTTRQCKNNNSKIIIIFTLTFLKIKLKWGKKSIDICSGTCNKYKQ